MVCTLLLASCPAAGQADTLHADFDDAHDRVWVGEDFWQRPLEDWRVRDGRVECTSASARDLHLLTRELGEQLEGFELQVTVGHLAAGDGSGAIGFRLGIRDEIEDDRARLIRGEALHAMLGADGRLRLGRRTSQPMTIDWDHPVRLHLTARPGDAGYEVVLTATSLAPGGASESLQLTRVDPGQLVGGLAIAHNTGLRRGQRGARFWIDDWQVSGAKLTADTSRAFGPILWTMHTLSRGQMTMSVQMPPMGVKDPDALELQVQREGRWSTISTQPFDPHAYVAQFRVDDWDTSADVPYRVRYVGETRNSEPTESFYEGTVRAEPAGRAVKVAVFTGNTDTGFPNHLISSNVAVQDPDVLFFSGDQLYEGVGGYGIHRTPDGKAILNYLGKWYLFGIAFRDVMRDRLTICLPDDHDVYQGNIWGGGGRAVTMAHHQTGGYAQSAVFVNAVHRTQCSSMPSPFDPTPIDRGISVYYTDMVYGRVSFAILADRMFKDGPRGTVATWDGRPDWVTDETVDIAGLDKPGLRLLGTRQEAFLEHWAGDWDGADMKAVLSQTIFVNLANYHGPGQRYVIADLDSNGWPQSGRHRGVELMRKGFAMHLAGDQHLPSMIHYGLEGYADGGVAFCCPSIAAGYPRSWRPDDEGQPPANPRPADWPANTGDYQDGFLNNVRVYAIGNPAPQNRRGRLNTLHDKSSGHGLVHIDPTQRTYTVECFRLQFDAENPQPTDQFPGWPRTFTQMDQYAQTPASHLPTLNVAGATDPLVRVYTPGGESLLYALRIKETSFRPMVFDPDVDAVYPIEVQVGSNIQHLELSPGEGAVELRFPR